MKKKLSLKSLNDSFCRFIPKIRRMVKLVLAIAVVVSLSGILCGLILIQATSNYQTDGAIANQTVPNYQTDTAITNQTVSDYQTNNTTTNQTVPNYQTSSTISNVGIVKTIGIGAYWDANLTNRVSAIEWGILEPGAQKSFTLYIRSEGNSAVTLSQSTSNWNPTAAANYMTLSWDYNGQTIKAGENLRVTLTLSVSANITGITNFSFDVIIIGNG